MTVNYPVFPKDETVVEDFFGTKVTDPYRWLENPDSEKTKAFVDMQNGITTPYIDSCTQKEEIKAKISEVWDYEKYSCPFRRGSHYFYFYNSGLQNQSVLCMMDELKGKSRVFFDPNALSTEGVVALNTYGFSEDGEYFAYGLSNAGSDWVTIKVRKVATGEDLEDKLEQVKFTTISWTHDNKGFFYARFPDAAVTADGTETDSNENQKLMYHRIGSSQTEDILCAERPDQPKFMLASEVSDCGRYVFVTVNAGCERNNLLYYCDLQKINFDIREKLDLVPIMDKFEAVFNYVTNEGTIVTIHTDLGAPMYKLINIDLNNLDRKTWKDLVAHDDSSLLEWATCINKKDLIICHMKDVQNKLSVFNLDTGEKVREIPTSIGCICALTGKKSDTTMFFQFTSFFTPGTSYLYDLTNPNAAPEMIFETRLKGMDLSNLEVNQIFYKSKDGTTVPMFIMHNKDFVADGSPACLLNGYGGFNISRKPGFSLVNVMFLLNFKGVVAVANIRGGGEYGEKWHNGGKLLNKQNCFDDFIAASEYLIKNKYTNPDKLIIQGGSNGGLLVSACSNQRPDLFGACICHVPVTDLLRFHKFTIGHAWQSEYGDIEKEENFQNLMRLSPLHNIRHPYQDGPVQYPATLVLTADHDDRVMPLHALKYIATLQEIIGRGYLYQKRPLLVRVDCKAGHGAGKPTSKMIDEITVIFAFLQVALGLTWHS